MSKNPIVIVLASLAIIGGLGALCLHNQSKPVAAQGSPSALVKIDLPLGPDNPTKTDPEALGWRRIVSGPTLDENIGTNRIIFDLSSGGYSGDCATAFFPNDGKVMREKWINSEHWVFVRVVNIWGGAIGTSSHQYRVETVFPPMR